MLIAYGRPKVTSTATTETPALSKFLFTLAMRARSPSFWPKSWEKSLTKILQSIALNSSNPSTPAFTGFSREQPERLSTVDSDVCSPIQTRQLLGGFTVCRASSSSGTTSDPSRVRKPRSAQGFFENTSDDNLRPAKTSSPAKSRLRSVF
jgi:hypothetical protein